MFLVDGLVNLLTGIGTRRDRSTASTFYSVPMNVAEADALYTDNWIARKAVDIIPDDMTREWRSWQTEDAAVIYETEKRLRVRSKVKLALQYERLYGGAAILIGTGDSDPTRPLEVERIAQDGVRYLHVFSRHDLTADTIDTDLHSETFGLPLFFTPRFRNTIVQQKIHRSRFVFFPGLTAPNLWRENNDGWGVSVFQYLRQAILNSESTNANTAALIDEAKIDIIKMDDLEEKVSTADSRQRLETRLTVAQQMKSTLGLLLIGGSEDYDTKQPSFAGLTDIMHAQLRNVAAALDIPVTRFLGQSPTGLAASGDTELRSYYDTIRARQTTDLSDHLKTLDDALVFSSYGTKPEGIDSQWTRLWTPTAEERSKIEKTNAEVDQIYINAGIFPEEKFALAIRDRLIENETYPSLDQHVAPEDLDFVKPTPQEFGLPPPPVPAEIPEEVTADARPRPLYVQRKVMNASDIKKWAQEQGFQNIESDLHVTIAYSRQPVDWMKAGESYQGKIELVAGGPRVVEPLGDKGAVVLFFASNELTWRHQRILDIGASWDWDDFKPHITISYEPGDIDLENIEPYRGEIVLGPEIFEELDLS